MSDDTGLKAIITCSVLAGALVLAIVIAKLVDNCYTKRQNRDTGSEVSDNMHDLIQSRLSVIRFKQKGRKTTRKRVEKNFFSKWLQLSRSNKQSRDKVLHENRQSMGISNNNDGEVIVKPSADSVSVKDPPRTPRASIFAGGKSPNQIKRETSSNQIKREVSSVTVTDLTRTHVSPVAKGQPVSSIIHQVQQSPAAISTINESESRPATAKRENTKVGTAAISTINESESRPATAKRETTKVGTLTPVREKTSETLSKQETNSVKSTT